MFRARLQDNEVWTLADVKSFQDGMADRSTVCVVAQKLEIARRPFAGDRRWKLALAGDRERIRSSEEPKPLAVYANQATRGTICKRSTGQGQRERSFARDLRHTR